MNKRNEHLRRCTGCGEMKPKKEMIRIVKIGEGEFTLDFTGKVNGRGAYVCDNKDCISLAVKGKGPDRSFKESVPKSLYDELNNLIQGR